MSEQWLYTIVFLAWLFGAAAFVLGLHAMNSPATARYSDHQAVIPTPRRS